MAQIVVDALLDQVERMLKSVMHPFAAWPIATARREWQTSRRAKGAPPEFSGSRVATGGVLLQSLDMGQTELLSTPHSATRRL
jgi:hypothetical protein